MTDVRLKLAPPWVTYVNKIIALFGEDPDINIDFDNEEMNLNIKVDNADKASILTYWLPEEKRFGNVTMFISVIPANGKLKDMSKMSYKCMFDLLFDKNPVFSFCYAVTGLLSNTVTYVVFKNEVVQWFNDNLNDVYGNISTLYQEIASDIFECAELNGVCYCTDKPKTLASPLGEWP